MLYCISWFDFFNFRGKEFRKDFDKLSVLRSLFPEVPFLCLTATAPISVITKIKKSLAMKTYIVISVNPNRKNVFLSKRIKKDKVHGLNAYEEILVPIAEELAVKQMDYPQTIIYCHLRYAFESYRIFRSVLQANQYTGVRKPSNSLINQFHAEHTDLMKKEILHEISKENSKIRVVFATAALGIGVNAPYIKKVIHLAPPSTLEAYVQEFGRAGRTPDSQAEAILYYSKSEISDWQIKNKLINESMVSYCQSEDKCLRKMLMNYFGFPAVKQNGCCSICEPPVAVNQPSDSKKKKFRKLSKVNHKSLSAALDKVVSEYSSSFNAEEQVFSMLLGIETATDLSRKMESVLKNVERIENKESLDKFNFNQANIAEKVMELIDQFTDML